jgi:hypothetical protein
MRCGCDDVSSMRLSALQHVIPLGGARSALKIGSGRLPTP